MQKHWYIIYTKAKCEKKVAVTLAKRKIESYCPLNGREIKSFRRKKIQYEPLFSAYVFVYLSKEDIGKIVLIDGVVNLLYWRGEPAVIGADEIDAIREFTSNHLDIKLEKNQINSSKISKRISGPIYTIEGNILTVKNTAAKVNLPSIGYTMIAEIESDNVLGRGVGFGNKELSLQ